MPAQPREDVQLTASSAVLDWQRRAVLIVDLVESVRLMRLDEREAINRWCSFVDEVCAQVLPDRGGRMVKSLGDGMLLEFPSAGPALTAAFELHRRIARLNEGREAAGHMLLRIGCHVADIAVTAHDVFGDGVNLTQRLCGLARPGETVGSASAREALIDGVDGEAEDMGECFVKHFDQPVRAYRLRPAGSPAEVLRQTPHGAVLRPAIAVVPFSMHAGDATAHAVGDLIADGVITQLSLAKHLQVVSRLSSALYRDRPATADDVGARLAVQYVLSGSYVQSGSRLTIRWTLAETDGQGVIEAGSSGLSVADLLTADCGFIDDLAAAVHDAIFRVEAARARVRPLPNLASYALLLGGIQLLHRAARTDFARSFELLSHLAELHPRAAEPRLWLAKWYALRAVQGLSSDLAADARAALDCTARALDAEPDSAFALAMEGFVHCHLTRDHDLAQRRLQSAVQRNPSETFGHLFQAVVHGLRADFRNGITSAECALATSPLDPARYLFDSIASYLHLGAGDLDRAIALAQRSLRQNCLHAHTWRALTIAQVERGDLEEARESFHHLMDVQPGLTLQTYLAGAQPDDPVRTRFAEALGRAGVPAH